MKSGYIFQIIQQFRIRIIIKRYNNSYLRKTHKGIKHVFGLIHQNEDTPRTLSRRAQMRKLGVWRKLGSGAGALSGFFVLVNKTSIDDRLSY